MIVVLTTVTAVSGGVLAWVNKLTEEPIEAIARQATEEAIRNVIVGESDMEISVEKPVEQDGFVCYAVNNADGRLLGTAVETTDKNGFGGPIKMMVGFSTEGEILGYSVLEHSETPGLGARADAWFRQSAGHHNIIGMNPGEDFLTVSKDGGEVDAITAATITSKAFLRAVNAAYKSVFGYTQADGVSGASAQQ